MCCFLVGGHGGPIGSLPAPSDADVPCNGCTACCRNQLILLTKYDDVASYDAHVVRHPINGTPIWAVKQRENGDCVYLGEGCTIHDRAPYLCRQFDCRAIYREMLDVGSDADIDNGIAAGLTNGEIIAAARDRSA